jgi:hypothetical protein
MINKTLTGAMVAVAGLAGTSSTFGITLDLTTAGASGTINGAIYQQAPPQPTGTGYIDSFVRVQINPASGTPGIEQGYNATVRPVMPDVKTDPIFTHDIQLSSVPIVNGYYQFLLDINEPNGSKSGLTLFELEIWLKGSPLTSAATYADLSGSGAVKTYDMDGAPAGDSRVNLDASLNSGSGSGDMFLYVPVTTLGTDGSKYVYLFSAFGNVDAMADEAQAGFEEWAVLNPQAQVPDAGSTVMLLGVAMLGFEGLRRRFSAKA